MNLTIFSCPKPFKGLTNIIQRNAIQSWKMLDSNIDIILLGKVEGIDKISKEFGIRYFEEVDFNEYGTPLINSIFEKAEKLAKYEKICYINSDIILLKNFIYAIKLISSKIQNCILAGRRWNLNLKEPINFTTNWEKLLIEKVIRYGKISPPFSIDYFVFSKGILGEIPPFAIGRPAWDNWIIYRAIFLKIPIIDLSKIVIVIHQNHNYYHCSEKFKRIIKNKESKKNIILAGEIPRVYSLLDANYKLTKNGILDNKPPFFSPFYIYKNLVIFSKSYSFIKPLIKLIKIFGNIIYILKVKIFNFYLNTIYKFE